MNPYSPNPIASQAGRLSAGLQVREFPVRVLVA